MERREMVDEVPFGKSVEQIDLYAHMDDTQADECIRKIAGWERFRKFWVDFYTKRIAEINEKCDRNIAYQKRNLRDFFSTVPHRSTKTMEAYDLPSGRLSISMPKQTLSPNKEAVLQRLIDSGEMDFVKTKTVNSLDWEAYKSRLFIGDNGEVLDKETGEVVNDVVVNVTEATFSVKAQETGDEEE